MLSAWPLHPDPLGRGASPGLVAETRVGQGRGEGDLRRRPRRAPRLSRQGGAGLRASSRSSVWRERSRQLRARMKYAGAHSPRRWTLTSEVKCWDVITQAGQACLPPVAAGSAPPPCHKQAWGNEVLPDPLPHQPSALLFGPAAKGWLTLAVAERQDMQRRGAWVQPCRCRCPGPPLHPTRPQPGHGASDHAWEGRPRQCVWVGPMN